MTVRPALSLSSPPARRRIVFTRRPAAARFVSRRGTRRLVTRRLAATANRAGFTLIEMLVATTLVLLMMLLFAEVFGLATETVTMRKGMAANDQKARLLTTRFDNDLSARTFRTVVAFSGRTFAYVERQEDVVGDAALEVVGWQFKPETDGGNVVFASGSGTTQVPGTLVQLGSLESRRGFLSISENDPDDDTDDVFSWTIDRRLVKNRGGVVYSPGRGKAAVLRDAGGTVITDQPATDQYNTSGAVGDEKLGDSPVVGTEFGDGAGLHLPNRRLEL